jgi:hypothetical protein
MVGMVRRQTRAVFWTAPEQSAGHWCRVDSLVVNITPYQLMKIVVRPEQSDGEWGQAESNAGPGAEFPCECLPAFWTSV